VPVFLSVLDASGVWIFKCADPNVVSVLDTGVYERTGVAGAADEVRGNKVRAAGPSNGEGGECAPCIHSEQIVRCGRQFAAGNSC
jgi:hypothetical protein